MNEINEYSYLTFDFHIRHCSSRVIPSISGKALVDISHFIKIVTDFNPDIIHSHLFDAEMLSRWDSKPGIVYITHCHSNMRQLKKRSLKDLKRKADLTDYYERRLLIKRYRKCNNNFIAISNDTKLFLKENIPNDLHNIFLLNNAVDIDRFKRPDPFIMKVINKEKVRLVNIGSFVDNKNQSFLIDVVALLHKRGYYVCLDLLGKGPKRSLIQEKINTMGLSSFIYCHGNVDNVEDYLHKADIYVHSALSEAFGLVLIEAMAAGLPVVCLDGKGNRDIINEGQNGFMIKEVNVELFAEKLIQLINDKELYSRLSENTVNFVKDYDIKSYVVKLMKIYEEVISVKNSV